MAFGSAIYRHFMFLYFKKRKKALILLKSVEIFIQCSFKVKRSILESASLEFCILLFRGRRYFILKTCVLLDKLRNWGFSLLFCFLLSIWSAVFCSGNQSTLGMVWIYGFICGLAGVENLSPSSSFHPILEEPKVFFALKVDLRVSHGLSRWESISR